MAGQMTSQPKKCYHLAEQFQGCLLKINLLCSTLKERRLSGWIVSAPSPLFHDGGLSQLARPRVNMIDQYSSLNNLNLLILFISFFLPGKVLEVGFLLILVHVEAIYQEKNQDDRKKLLKIFSSFLYVFFSYARFL